MAPSYQQDSYIYLFIYSYTLVLFLILLLGSFLRLFLLNSYPTGITDDELHFVLNAKSIFYTSRNLAQNWTPFQLSTIPNEESSELSHALIAPIIGPLPTNLFTARLPFVLYGILFILVLYRFVLNTTGDVRLARASAFIYAINPWAIFTSRTSFDAPISLFFLFLGLLLATEKSTIKYFSPVAFFLSFYSYIATKTLLLPFLILAYFSYYRHYQAKLFKLICIIFFVTTALFAVKQYNTPSRVGELVTPSLQRFKDQVIAERNQSQFTPVTKLYSNTYTVMVRFMAQKYLASFDPKILFMTGDNTFLILLWRHGYFYLIDGLLILVGLLSAHKYNRRFVALLLGMILIAPLPSILRKDELAAIAFHSYLTFTALSILVAMGLTQILKTSKGAFFVLPIYLMSILSFLYIYFYQYPYYQPEGFSYTNRQVIDYTLSNGKKTFTVVTNQPETLFKNYLFYSNSYKPIYANILAQIYKNRNNIIFGKVGFTDTFPEKLSAQKTYIVQVEKFKEQTNIKIVSEIKRISDQKTTYYVVESNP